MNNRNSMLYVLYTIGAKYAYMWYKERSSDEDLRLLQNDYYNNITKI